MPIPHFEASNTNARLEIDIGSGHNGKITVGGSYLVNIYKEESIERFRKLYAESFEDLIKEER